MISICEFHAGHARNVIPQTAELRGTVRTLTPEVRELVEKRVREVVEGVATITGAKIDLVYERGYPVTVNHGSQTEFATRVAKKSPATPTCTSTAIDGRGRFCVHAGSAARCLYLLRQRRRRRPASPRL